MKGKQRDQMQPTHDSRWSPSYGGREEGSERASEERALKRFSVDRMYGRTRTSPPPPPPETWRHTRSLCSLQSELRRPSHVHSDCAFGGDEREAVTSILSSFARERKEIGDLIRVTRPQQSYPKARFWAKKGESAAQMYFEWLRFWLALKNQFN